MPTCRAAASSRTLCTADSVLASHVGFFAHCSKRARVLRRASWRCSSTSVMRVAGPAAAVPRLFALTSIRRDGIGVVASRRELSSTGSASRSSRAGDQIASAKRR